MSGIAARIGSVPLSGGGIRSRSSARPIIATTRTHDSAPSIGVTAIAGMAPVADTAIATSTPNARLNTTAIPPMLGTLGRSGLLTSFPVEPGDGRAGR